MCRHTSVHLDHSENDLLSVWNLLYFPTTGMSFQKTALRKGNLPGAFQGPDKQYFFLMASPSLQILAAVPKSDSFAKRTNERCKNAQKPSLFLPLLIMRNAKDTSQRQVCILRVQDARCWAALPWGVSATSETGGLAALDPRSQPSCAGSS